MPQLMMTKMDQFPSDMFNINPKLKNTEKSYYDPLSLCLKLQMFPGSNIIKEPKVVESNPEIVER